MEQIIETRQDEAKRRPWKQPSLQELNVALDTASGNGSNIDGNSGTTL